MSPTHRPNILWISFEDTAPFYGCYGDRAARTPHLDRLAGEGCLYENAFSTAPVCAPARSAIITGMYPTSFGAHHMRTSHVCSEFPDLPTPYETVPPPEVKCFPEFLRASGYFCTNRIKTDYQFDSPISAWDEHGFSAHWRNRTDPNQPFFSVFNFEETHESGCWNADDAPTGEELSEISVPPFLPDTPKVRRTLARIYALITQNDQRLGSLLQQLEDDGLADNTIVMHWSDHGPLPRGKRWLYDSGIRVPLIVRWPGRIAPGLRETRLVSTLDLGPTVLSLCGLPVPPYMEGNIFLGDRQDPSRQSIFASRDRMDTHYDRVRAVRNERYKYIKNFYPYQSRFPWLSYLNRHPIMQEMRRLYLDNELTVEQSQLFEERRPVEELYDLQEDPFELHNLADCDEQRPMLEKLRRTLDDWIEETGDLGRQSEFEMVRRWYPDGFIPVTGAPVFAGLSETECGIAPLFGHARLTTPCEIQLSCGTQGASIVYQWEGEPSGRWHLYFEPLELRPGRHILRTQAVRLGYHPSSISTLEVVVATNLSAESPHELNNLVPRG